MVGFVYHLRRETRLIYIHINTIFYWGKRKIWMKVRLYRGWRLFKIVFEHFGDILEFVKKKIPLHFQLFEPFMYGSLLWNKVQLFHIENLISYHGWRWDRLFTNFCFVKHFVKQLCLLIPGMIHCANCRISIYFSSHEPVTLFGDFSCGFKKKHLLMSITVYELFVVHRILCFFPYLVNLPLH